MSLILFTKFSFFLYASASAALASAALRASSSFYYVAFTFSSTNPDYY